MSEVVATEERQAGIRIVTRDVATLQSHPLSLELFGVMADDLFQSLKDDINERGLQQPMEADAQERIICGSQRLRALKELQWGGTEIVVRDDLVTEEAIRKHLILDNHLRRQFTPIQQWKASRELRRIEDVLAAQRMKDGKTLAAPAAKGKAVDRVAKMLGVSGDTIERLDVVYESGNDKVKDALDRGELSITAAAQKIRPPKLTTHRLSGDDPRAQALRFAKFTKEAEGVEKWIKANPPAKFDAHEPEARTRLQRLSNRLQEALETAEKAA